MGVFCINASTDLPPQLCFLIGSGFPSCSLSVAKGSFLGKRLELHLVAGI